MKPELYLINGDEIFEMISLSRNLSDQKILERKNYLNSLYQHGICEKCKSGMGSRTAQSLIIKDSGSWIDAGWVRGPIRNHSRLFSDNFISLLHPEEKKRFIFQPVETPKRVKKRKYFELIAQPHVRFVGVKGFDADGVECNRCGGRSFSVDEPILQQGGVFIDGFICRNDIPDPIPSCFPVGVEGKEEICMTRQRWDEIRGHKYAKGVMSRQVGVVSEEQCERHPRLRNRFWHCEICNTWEKPRDENYQERRVFDIPINPDCGLKNLQRVISAAEKDQLKIVRQTLTIEDLRDYINTGKKPKQPEIISFRCPNCWKLGRIILNTKEIEFLWF